ncbi:MAG: hypothetical protein IH621_17645 [Krumholzibacteria bacterium]|nr:hypothetical protein [Candidatus Krumholzibacteria bacterium]
MISIRDDSLVIACPEVHPDATVNITFHRTLRIPDDDTVHFLPPGLGAFPLRNVDACGAKVPHAWRERGGVMLPMFQSEAMWMSFGGLGFEDSYPFILKIAAGGINAVTGETWTDTVTRKPQNYVVTDLQPWLDGFCVARGEIRQFVAMPLGAGYSAEEQITGRAEVGGLQIVAYPMKAAAWRKLQAERKRRMAYWENTSDGQPCFCIMSDAMGLSPGGRMRQEIYDDPHDFGVWDLAHTYRCFVHIANSLTWRAITGEAPPTLPPTAKQYTEAGLPWFDWYDEKHTAVGGSGVLAGLKSVKQMGEQKGEHPLPENDPAGKIMLLPLGPGQVRLWQP